MHLAQHAVQVPPIAVLRAASAPGAFLAGTLLLQEAVRVCYSCGDGGGVFREGFTLTASCSETPQGRPAAREATYLVLAALCGRSALASAGACRLLLGRTGRVLPRGA